MHDDEGGSLDRLDFENLYRPLFASDVAGAKVSAPAFLFSPLLRSKTLTMISAEPFTGKTLLMLSMLLSLDTGSSLLGRFQPASGARCLFIGQDAPTWDYHGQFLKLFYGLGLAPASEACCPLPSMLLLNRGFSLLEPDFLTMIEQAISLYSINVLFLDTLLEFHNVDENSNRDMKRVMGLLKHIRDVFDITIFFSHHTNKLSGFTASAFAGPRTSAGKSLAPNDLPISRNLAARGASVIGGSVDSHIALRASGATETGLPIVELSLPKGRGLDSLEPVFFSISPVYRSDRTPALALAHVVDTDPKEIILRYLSTPRLRADILSHLSSRGITTSDSSLTRTLSGLSDKGLIQSPSHGVWEKTR